MATDGGAKKCNSSWNVSRADRSTHWMMLTILLASGVWNIEALWYELWTLRWFQRSFFTIIINMSVTDMGFQGYNMIITAFGGVCTQNDHLIWWNVRTHKLYR